MTGSAEPFRPVSFAYLASPAEGRGKANGAGIGMRASKEKKPGRTWKASIFVLLLVLCAALLLLRYHHIEQAPEAAEQPEIAVSPTPTLPAAKTEASPTPAAAPSAAPPAVTTSPEPVSAAEETQPHPARRYTEKTYKLVSDMVYTYRVLVEDGTDEVNRLVENLKTEDPELGAAWESIMAYWAYVNTDLEIHTGVIPEGLPEDDSLCFVVLGYELLYDGNMAPELIGRCELALACAERYPNACLALTGGGTALGNKTATEAGVMEAWFTAKGLPAERLILEDRSKTTADNAQFTCAILAEGYPQIKNLVIVSSDYHIQMGCLLFEEEAFLFAWENGTTPYSVVSNAALATPGRDDYKGTKKQAEYLWTLADPHYY